MAQNAHLLLSKTKIMLTIPSPRGGFGGLTHPNKVPSPPN